MREENLKILSSLVDINRELSISSFFKLFQDAAMVNADEIGIGRDKTIDRGWLWIFTRVLVEIEEMPKYTEDAKIATYPCGSRGGFLFHRQAYLKNKDDKVVVRLSSQWAIIDASTRKLVLRPAFPEISENHDNPLELPGKVEHKESTLLYSRRVRFSDCDLNAHLNNVRYVDFIVDINPSSFYKEYRISKLLINYNHEVHEGETIEIYVNDDKTYVEGHVNGINCFEAEISYKRR